MELFQRRLNLLLFPYDLTSLNGYGCCCLSKPCYTAFRIIILCLALANFIYIAYYLSAKDLLQFTMWGVIISTFCPLFLLFQNIYSNCNPHSTLWKWSHFLFSITIIFQIFISAVYWCGLFPYSLNNLWNAPTSFQTAQYVTKHAVPTILLIIDLFFNPILLWNFIHLPFYFSILIVYLIVNCVYTLQVQQVYPQITFRNWLTYVFLIACIVAILICHILLRMFCKFFKEDNIRFLLNTFIKQSTHEITFSNKPNRNQLMTDNIKNESLKNLIGISSMQQY